MQDQWPWIAAVIVTLGLIGGIVFFDSKGKSSNSGGEVPAEVATITETDWAKGPTDAPVTIIEYSDFQCPACRAYQPLIQKVLEARDGKIRFVYRHFPLSSHANSEEAARASEAAGKQGKFWEMHDRLFDEQQAWAGDSNPDERFAGYAGGLGLNVDQFKADYASEAIDDAVDADRISGNDAGVNATPTIIVNGKKLADNPGSFEEFVAIVDAEVSSGN